MSPKALPLTRKTCRSGCTRFGYLVDYVRFSVYSESSLLDARTKTEFERDYFEEVALRYASSLGVSLANRELTTFGRYGYRHKIVIQTGVIMYGVHRTDETGMCIEFSGQGMEYMRFNGWTDRTLITRLAEDGWKCTRLDYAVDVYNGRRVGYIAHILAIGQWAVKPNTSLTGWTDYQTGASTLYIGSRSSERFLRIYDKGTKDGDAIGRTRYEMQYNGRLADWACSVVMLGYDTTLIEDAQSKCSLPNHSGLISVYSVNAVAIAKPKKVRLDSRKVEWLKRCIKSIVKAAAMIGIVEFCGLFNTAAETEGICQITPKGV